MKEKDGGKFLNRNHDYFYQVMGQLCLTGASWCDFMVWCPEDHFVERIYFIYLLESIYLLGRLP